MISMKMNPKADEMVERPSLRRVDIGKKKEMSSSPGREQIDKTHDR